MGREYQETEMSRRVREILTEPIFTIEGKVQRPVPEYSAEERSKYLTREGIFDPSRIFWERVLVMSGGRPIPRELTEVDFAEFCVELNLSEGELEFFMRTNYSLSYDPKFKGRQYGEGNLNAAMGSVATARMLYEKHCKDLGLEPRDDFPDWGNWQEAVERTRDWHKEVAETMRAGRPTKEQLRKLIEG